MKKKKRVVIKEIDKEILQVLYKTGWMTEKQISVLVGENPEYIKGRLKKLCNAGLVNRKVMDRIAVNWLTREGMAETGLEFRNINTPTLSKYEHTMGVNDICVWLARWKRFKDGERSWIPIGRIITEKDIAAVKEMKMTGHRKDGQPVYVSADKDIHCPDGYIVNTQGLPSTAIEFERTAKSSNAILRKNVAENFKRFSTQLWSYQDPYVGKVLRKVQAEVGTDKMTVIDIRSIRADLDHYIEIVIPEILTEKTGEIRKSCLGSFYPPIPLNRIPLRPEFKSKVQLETRENKLPVNVRTVEKPASPVAVSAMTPPQPAGKSLFERR